MTKKGPFTVRGVDLPKGRSFRFIAEELEAALNEVKEAAGPISNVEILRMDKGVLVFACRPEVRMIQMGDTSSLQELLDKAMESSGDSESLAAVSATPQAPEPRKSEISDENRALILGWIQRSAQTAQKHNMDMPRGLDWLRKHAETNAASMSLLELDVLVEQIEKELPLLEKEPGSPKSRFETAALKHIHQGLTSYRKKGLS